MKLRTIQELAKLSKVSIRTLRYYDEIGLLCPKIRMANGRSLYGMKELIYLTQIITFKEFGFSLNKIKSILNDKPAYKLSKLIAQKKILTKELDRLKSSFQMIDSLIHHYQENTMLDITPEQIEAQFEQMKSKQEYAKYYDEAFMEAKTKQSQEKFRLEVGNDYYESFLKNTALTNVLTAQDYGRRYGIFLNKLSEALEKTYPPESTEVNALINEQWEILQLVYPKTRSQKIYFAIRDQVCDFPGEDKQTLLLRDFLYKAMTTFGQEHFCE